MITVLLVLALARSRRGQRALEAIGPLIAPLIAMAIEAFTPIIVELANLGRSITTVLARHLPRRWRDRHG
jgi:hypothetical protein